MAFQRPVKKEKPQKVNKVDTRIQKLILAVGEQTLPRKQIMAEVGLRQGSLRIFFYNYLHPAYEKGYINLVFPDAPNNPDQAYRLTCNGLELYAKLTGRTDIFY